MRGWALAFAALLVMGTLAVLMILWFWRRGWLRRTDR